ncbi:MAG: transcription factor [Methanocalculaceae archaeon]|jgi:transcription initiation factor TFIIE subunit alpha|nr:transcription factor [Methanocalculaceae archaeon]
MTAITENELNNPAIFQYLRKLVGEEGVELLRRCPDEELSDEDIAAKTAINLNSVRRVLYNLYEHRLAEYRRIKNNETGWLTYLWVMRMDNLNTVLWSEIDTSVGKLSARLHYDATNDFYQCKNCGQMTTFNNACTTDFACQNCGRMLVHFDDEQLLIAALRNRVGKMREVLGNV